MTIGRIAWYVFLCATACLLLAGLWVVTCRPPLPYVGIFGDGDLNDPAPGTLGENLSDDALEALHQEIWRSFTAALIRGDTRKALEYVTYGSRSRFGDMFAGLQPADAEKLFAACSALRRSEISGGMAEYAVTRQINGEPYVFMLYFLQDSDGVWRIDSM